MDDGRRALRIKGRWCRCRVGTSPTPTMDDGRRALPIKGRWCRCRVGTRPTPTMDDGRRALRRKYQACVRFICRHYPCYSVLGSVYGMGAVMVKFSLNFDNLMVRAVLSVSPG